MPRKLLIIILVILVGAYWLWNLAQWNLIQEQLAVLESSSLGVGRGEKTAGPEGNAASGRYDITIDMWQIFEQELRDYKQRLREGKQQFEMQQSVWEKLLADAKKNIQEYDRVLAAEGEFWEKQLKNYEKLIVTNEHRIETMEQLIYDLRQMIADVQQQWERRETQMLERISSEEQVIEKEIEKPKRVGEQISPKIQGAGAGYKTYPPAAESNKEKETEEEETNVIRGSITGSGDYTTY